eukprot:1563621-Pleurochrysis_carterae.AAC.1
MVLAGGDTPKFKEFVDEDAATAHPAESSVAPATENGANAASAVPANTAPKETATKSETTQRRSLKPGKHSAHALFLQERREHMRYGKERGTNWGRSHPSRGRRSTTACGGCDSRCRPGPAARALGQPRPRQAE